MTGNNWEFYVSDFGFLNAIRRSWVEIPCPECGISNRIMLGEIFIESSVLCKGCYMTLHLVQKDASGTRTKSSISRLDGEINRFVKDVLINISF